MNADPVISYAELTALLHQARHSRRPERLTDAQLLGLQRQWTTLLSARLDQAIEDAWVPTPAAAASAWHALAEAQPVLRGLLDDGLRERPGLASALDREHRMLALGAGLAGVDTPEEHAVELGRGFRARLSPTALERVA